MWIMVNDHTGRQVHLQIVDAEEIVLVRVSRFRKGRGKIELRQ